MLLAHVLDFRYETSALQRQLESKIEAKIRIFPPVKAGEGWAKCLSEFLVLDPGSNRYTFDGAPLGRLGD